MSRIVLGVALCVALVAAGGVAFLSMRHSGRLSCATFPTQQEAQAAYRANPAGLQALDADRDGIACEGNRVPRDLTPVVRAG